MDLVLLNKIVCNSLSVVFEIYFKKSFRFFLCKNVTANFVYIESPMHIC